MRERVEYCPRCGHRTARGKTRRRYVFFGRGYIRYTCRWDAHQWRVWLSPRTKRPA